MNLETLTAADIESMSYNELIGIVRETNRPPGGLRSIARIAQHTFVRPGQRILEIGTSTGVTAIELARLTGATVHGIDINPISLKEAQRRAVLYRVDILTHFKQEDATQMSYPDSFFRMVFCGNVTSLIADRTKAVVEYARVLEDGGFLAAIPMYYVREPSTELVARVSEAIKVNITPQYHKDWIEFFTLPNFSSYIVENYEFDTIPSSTVDSFVYQMMSQQHLNDLKPDIKEVFDRKYRQQMHLFQENLTHMGYTILILKKEPHPLDPELFTSHPVTGGKK